MTLVHFVKDGKISAIDINTFSPEIHQPEEQILWGFKEAKGTIFRRISKIWAITNFRAFVYDFKLESITYLALIRDIDDVVVTNMEKVYDGNWMGANVNVADGFGVIGGLSTGTGSVIGDALFMRNGKVSMKWEKVADPYGVQNVFMTVKKEMFPRELGKSFE